MTIPLLRRWSTASGAVVAELDPAFNAPTVFARLAHRPATLFLDSALADPPAAGGGSPRLGRYSFVATDPIHSIEIPADTATSAADLAQAFAAIRRLLTDLACQTIPGLPPFQGGIAGLLAYECGLAVLGLPTPAAGVTAAPLVSLHAYDVVFAFDHDTRQGWVISQGVPARGPQARRQRAGERLDAVLAHVAQTSAGDSAPHVAQASACDSAPARACLHPLSSHPHVRSTFSREAYLAMVAAGIEYVRAGDIFQVNLAQQLAVDAAVDPVAVYQAARTCNPAPFAGYLATGDVVIASMSPERFLQVTGSTVRMHPIKEIGIRSVLTTEVIHWAASSVKECDLGRRLVHHAVANRTLPKHVEPRLVTLRAGKPQEFGDPELDRLATAIRDPNFRIFAERGEVHMVGAGLHIASRDPFLLFRQLAEAGRDDVDPSHAFYLGYEVAKAVTALTLGKDYRQDQALDWGHLTQPEIAHGPSQVAAEVAKKAAHTEPAGEPV